MSKFVQDPLTIKRRDSFSISFLEKGTQDPCQLKAIEPFVTSVDLGTELLTPGGYSHRTNTLIVWFYDDVASASMESIRSWIGKGNEPFTIIVKQFNGDVMSDMYAFRECKLSALQHSILTNEVQVERVIFPQRNSSGGIYDATAQIKPPVERELSAKLLQISFAEMEHHITSLIQ